MTLIMMILVGVNIGAFLPVFKQGSALLRGVDYVGMNVIVVLS